MRMLKNTQKLLFGLALVALFPSASFGIAVDPDDCYYEYGYYCEGSSSVICPSGYYCPGYSSSKYSCPDGTTSYSGADSTSDCYTIPCYGDAGYYCDSSNNKILCPSGSYCPANSSSKYSCPDGTTSYSGAGSKSDCYAIPEVFDAVKCVAMGTSSSCTHTPATEYQTDWGSQCSGVTVRGVSMCGNYDKVSDLSAGSVVDTVWRNDNASDNRACLCKIVQPVSSRWVYAETYYDENGDSGASRCSRYCALSCAGKIADVANNKKFHDNILGVLYE